ncbi:MAG: hypothetical protein FWD58_08255 [Firmicutes bacterium]|nr:hypothetical protein [Bacillota bacterium]
MFPVGLILLSVLAVLTFFGVSERFFRKIGVPDWLAFLLLLTFVVGAVVPEIPIGTSAVINVGGFIVPAVFLVIVFSVSRRKKEVARILLASLAVASVTVTARMLLRPESGGLFLAAMVITGVLGGIAAYLAGGTRLATLSGAVGGIMLGDIANNLIFHYAFGAGVALGSRGVFDSIIIAAVLGVVLLEIVEAIKRAASEKSLSSSVLNTEAAEDARLEKSWEEAAEEEEFKDYFENDAD